MINLKKEQGKHGFYSCNRIPGSVPKDEIKNYFLLSQALIRWICQGVLIFKNKMGVG